MHSIYLEIDDDISEMRITEYPVDSYTSHEFKCN